VIKQIFIKKYIKKVDLMGSALGIAVIINDFAF
jgi:hypothetical protein